MNKFWNFIQNAAGEQELWLNGPISEDTWFGDEVTPKMFKSDLAKCKNKDIIVWINSPGGDCVAASQIYTALMEYKGNVTVKIDGLAASAASVIAMAGSKVLMAPTAIMMIHNPWTIAMGDAGDMNHAADVLNEVKETIMSAYEIKSGMSRDDISELMDNETWMNANKAVEFGFADEVLYADKGQAGTAANAFSYSPIVAYNSFKGKLPQTQPAHDEAAEAAAIAKAKEQIKLLKLKYPEDAV